VAAKSNFPCNVYIDESSERGLRYTVIGGVIVPSSVAKEITAEIQNHKKHPSSELKWNRLDSRKIKLYEAVLKSFLDRRTAKKLHFHCIVIDNEKVDYDYSSGSVDLGFNKFIYQILLKFARLYSPRMLYVYPDERRTPQTGAQFRDVLNNGAAIHREIQCRPFKLVEFHKSVLTPLIQLADMLIGAVAYEVNGHNLQPNANSGKLAFLEALKSGTGISSFHSSTRFAEKTFTVWHFDFLKARK
jgi:hypothetical protein